MNEQTRNEIVRLWQGGASQRSIAQQLHLSRHTVRRVLEDVLGQRQGQSAKKRSRRPSKLDPYDQTIKELVERYPDITIMRLLEELKARGFPGGYTIVRQRLAQLRPRPTKTPVTRFETAPGAQAQMDYAVYDIDFSDEGRRRVSLFSYLLGYSRRQYLRFVDSQDFETTVRQHIRAFEHLGGVAATCLYDNMKVVVNRYEDDEPIYNARFLAFATHYGFRPVACRPRRPQTKGKVERPFHYVEQSLLNARTFRSLADLNDVTTWWLAHVADVRVHRHTGERPLDRHAQELEHLIALPTHPYEVAQVVYRHVSVEGLITYRQNFYSVPWHYIGQVLPVRITEDEVIVYDPHIEELARHRLWSRQVTGQRSQHQAHRPSEDRRQRHALLRDRFAQLGASGSAFLDRLVESQRRGKDQAHKILALLASYRREDLVAALERAHRYGAYSYAAIERILAVQAQPKSPMPTLTEQEQQTLDWLLPEGPIPPRSTADYQPLLATPDASQPAEADRKTPTPEQETEDGQEKQPTNEADEPPP